MLGPRRPVLGRGRCWASTTFPPTPTSPGVRLVPVPPSHLWPWAAGVLPLQRGLAFERVWASHLHILGGIVGWL